ncbi:hypothetical protein CPC08DRAFT_707812 [Agrocybe pediades]|nr:hypothetical protein CPC08DRAFT_707812 [Agrocybe pediades]
MPLWTLKGLSPNKPSFQQRKGHKWRAPSYDWTPPVPTKLPGLRKAPSSSCIESGSVSTSSCSTGSLPPPPYPSSPKSGSISTVDNTPASNVSASCCDSAPLSHNQDGHPIVTGIPKSNPLSPCSFTRRGRGRNPRPEPDLTDLIVNSYASSSSEGTSSSSHSRSSSSGVTDFFDNIYLERGPSTLSRKSSRYLHHARGGSITELPPVYGLSFPAVPETISVPASRKVAALQCSSLRTHRSMPQIKKKAASPRNSARPPMPVPVLQSLPRDTQDAKRITTLEERIEALRQELEELAAYLQDEARSGDLVSRT